jgi:RNA polymerase sigma factor (sigma-70 family)
MIDHAKYYKMVAGIASKYKPTSRYDMDDLVNEGMRVVVKAHQNYKPELGVPLDGYIVAAVKLELYKYAVANQYDLYVSEGVQRTHYKVTGSFDWLNKHANAHVRIHLDIDGESENEITIPASGDNQEEAVNKQQCLEILAQEMAKLPEEERNVIHSLFIEEKSYKETGQELNISNGAIATLRRKGLTHLFEKLKGRVEL